MWLCGFYGPRLRWEEEEVGRATLIQDEKSESWIGRSYGCQRFVSALCAPRSDAKSAEHPSEGGFEVIKKAVGLGCAA